MYLPFLFVFELLIFVQGRHGRTTYSNAPIDHQAIQQLFKLSPRITGGFEAAPNSLAYQVAMIIPVDYGHALCGGSLLTTKTVLTAAHCFENTTGTVTIILGAHYIRKYEATQTRRIMSKAIVHENYDPQLVQNDIALAVMDRPIELNDCIKLVRLPYAPSPVLEKVGRKALVSGWGRFTDYLKYIAPTLREVELPIISNGVCNIFYGGNIKHGQICVGDFTKKSTCGGDSGGPVLVDGVQIGLVSFGIAMGCEVGWPSVLTRVSCYLDWIQAHAIY